MGNFKGRWKNWKSGLEQVMILASTETRMKDKKWNCKCNYLYYVATFKVLGSKCHGTERTCFSTNLMLLFAYEKRREDLRDSGTKAPYHLKFTDRTGG
jgi:hypothetical protein